MESGRGAEEEVAMVRSVEGGDALLVEVGNTMKIYARKVWKPHSYRLVAVGTGAQ